jgi:glucan-binding YG repeat protein
MNHLKSTLILLLSVSLLSCLIAPASFADSKKKIGKIYLTFDSNLGMKDEGSNIEVTPTGNNTNYYNVDNVEVINDNEDGWTNSNPPEVEITLSVNDEDAYYFSGSSSSDFKLALSNSAKSYYDKIKFIDAKRKDSNATLLLRTQLLFDEDADTSRAAAPSYVRWDSSMNGKGNWSDVNSSKYYQVQLIKDGNEMESVLSIYNTAYDFSGSITQPGSYCFKVRSVKNSNNAKSQWITSNIMVVNQEGIRRTSGDSVGGGWKRAEDGTRWWWQNSDGTYPVSQWKKENEKWYYFNDQGYMAAGWINLNGVYYYLDTVSGEMYVNRRTPDNYWVNEEGVYVPQV